MSAGGVWGGGEVRTNGRVEREKEVATMFTPPAHPRSPLLISSLELLSDSEDKRARLWDSLAWLYYCWEACSFPLEGLIEELALCVSPSQLRESGQARPSGLAACSRTQRAGATAYQPPQQSSRCEQGGGFREG
ncbi:hypothetical protein NQZ68_027508 [Dissostichus eleginoides]|nr:hypothetical protein NQZ68_027508 [Dissostichus eleginoides]